MNDNEAKQLYRRIFIAAPDYANWVSEKIEDPAATMAVWRKMLTAVPVDVGELVVSQLESGERMMPAAYERGAFGAVFRSWCMQVLDERKKSERNEALLRDGFRDVHNRIYADPCMGRALRLMNAADDDYQKGEIDAQARDRIKRDALRLVNPKS